MTALTENRYTRYRDGLVTAHPVQASAVIYKGSLVCVDATGYALPGADTADYVFLGVAIEEADNSAGSDGDVTVRVQTSGVFSFAKIGSLSQANCGVQLYIADDQTVAAAATTTNDIPCGRLEGIDGDDVWVRVQL